MSTLILSFSLTFSVCNADTKHVPEAVDISYGFTQLKISYDNNVDLKGDHAFHQFKAAVFPADYFRQIDAAIMEAVKIDDLKPYITDKNYQSLKEKVKSGRSQYNVLAMVQAMRPMKSYIIKSQMDIGHAQLIVSGQSYVGPMRGIVDLNMEQGVWKIDHESFIVTKEAQPKNDRRMEYTYVKPMGIISAISPDYKLDRNFLALKKTNLANRKQSFMFVFLMDKEDGQPKEAMIPEAKKVKGKTVAVKNNQRSRMHLLWTGSEKIVSDQKVVENEYPIDVSIAKYDDGYAADELNLVLPNKKPREVAVSWLWTF